MSPDSLPEFLTAQSEMAAHIRRFDWSGTPLGPPENWPPGLQNAVKWMLGSGHPMVIWWGEQRLQLYNDAHAPSLSQAHPGALARPGPEVWGPGWDVVGPQVDRVLAGEQGGWYADQTIRLARNGEHTDTNWTYSLNAIADPQAPNGVGGVMLIGLETTQSVRALAETAEALATRSAEHAQARLEQMRLQAMFNSLDDFLGFIAPDGTLQDANTAALRAIGASLADVVGRKFWHAPWFAATPGLPAQIEHDVARAAAGETVRRDVDIRLPTGERAFAFSLRPAYSTEGVIIGVVPAAIERTAYLHAEEQRRQAEKMEAVGQLTGGLAHDFNNLLTGISGSLDLLKTRIAQGRAGEAGRYISAAETSASRAADLTHRLLAFSRRQTLDPKPLQANTLIAGMEDRLRHSIGPGITLQTKFLAGLWTIRCDARQLENAILNLCQNARDAMPEGGTLTLQTDNIILDERQARARDMPPGAYAGIFVTDTGTGMSPETAARAFDPFFTTKPIGTGTGLGLSMIHGFTQQSGGQVRIHSAPGQGTTMCMFLPRYRPDEQPRPAPQPRPLAAPGQHQNPDKTVLVVDDEPGVRMLVTEVLEELGLTTLEAADGASGLHLLQSAARIDLLVSDVGLPGGINGRQMADAARQLRPELKVLFITGYAETAVIGNGSLEPGMEVMTKPFALEGLAGRIKALLAAE